jgi:8-oxo-dGTP pyrophosphatase MutT (NUDIX family)
MTQSPKPRAAKSSDHPRPAAAVAFVRDTTGGIQIYLSRRPAHFRYFPGAFVFPGGRAETDDADMKATACREVKEEIGVEIDPGRLALLRETHTAAHAGPVYHLFIFACQVDREFATSINTDEIDEEIWITARDALATLDLPYQIMAAVQFVARFSNAAGLIEALKAGPMDGEYLY